MAQKTRVTGHGALKIFDLLLSYLLKHLDLVDKPAAPQTKILLRRVGVKNK